MALGGQLPAAASEYRRRGLPFLRPVVAWENHVADSGWLRLGWRRSRRFCAQLAYDYDPQVQRVAHRFALVGFAGLLAVKHGIFLISPGTSSEAFL
jgi:hypothetical protein